MKTPSLHRSLVLLAALCGAGASASFADTATVFSSADSYFRSDNTSSTAGANDFRLLVGETASVTANDLRIALGFDLSALPSNITINSVSLVLRINENDTNAALQDTSVTLNLQGITQSWSEGSVSWNNASTGTPWTTAGGTFSGTVLSSAVVPTKGTAPRSYTWASSSDFVSFVQAAHDGGSIVSFMLKDANETGTLREIIRFVSRNETGTGLQAYRPQLVIDYTPVSSVPEPSAFAAIVGIGALGFVASRRRRR